jgi:hypothetical protein
LDNFCLDTIAERPSKTKQTPFQQQQAMKNKAFFSNRAKSSLSQHPIAKL